MSVEVTGCDSAVVSWMASQSMFDIVIGNYSVRYQLVSGSNDLTTVYTSSTNVTLEDLLPNAEYNVSVVGITSCGGTSSPAMTHLDLQGIFPACSVVVSHCLFAPSQVYMEYSITEFVRIKAQASI